MDITVERLSFSFPGSSEPILNNISFHAPDGEVTAVIGANGVGKTTLLKAVMNLYDASGTVRFGACGREEMSRCDLMRHISYMTQEGELLSTLTVLDTVLLGRVESLGLRVSDENLEKAWRALCLLKLEHLAERPLGSLSGGQRRVVNIAQAIVREPDVLIMDEPTANLDLQNQLEVLELVREYTRQKRIATILTLHDLNMAARYADKLVLLRDGAVYRAGTPTAVISEEAVRNAYGVHVSVTQNEDGIPMLHPIGSVRTQRYNFN